MPTTQSTQSTTQPDPITAPIAQDVLRELETVLAAIEETLAGLPAEAVNWVPAEGMNSMAVLATHVAGSQRHWIGQLVGLDPVARVRDDEFRATATDGDALVARLREVHAHNRQTLERLAGAAPTDLAREVDQPGDHGRVMWALSHALAHTAEHLGHLQITRQLWDARS